MPGIWVSCKKLASDYEKIYYYNNSIANHLRVNFGLVLLCTFIWNDNGAEESRKTQWLCWKRSFIFVECVISFILGIVVFIGGGFIIS
jgi:hypothetical protein